MRGMHFDEISLNKLIHYYHSYWDQPKFITKMLSKFRLYLPFTRELDRVTQVCRYCESTL